jgi:hypothetical protein
MDAEILEAVRSEYQAGKLAFEGGHYRQSVEHLQKASSLADRNSRLGGEVLTWLVTAYEAAGRRNEALALCKQLTNHPHVSTRKQNKRLLAILEAPQLKTHPEWLIEIPDLATLEDNESTTRQVSAATTKRSNTPRSQPEREPIDRSLVNTKDNQFIGLALVVTFLTLISLFFLN